MCTIWTDSLCCYEVNLCYPCMLTSGPKKSCGAFRRLCRMETGQCVSCWHRSQDTQECIGLVNLFDWAVWSFKSRISESLVKIQRNAKLSWPVTGCKPTKFGLILNCSQPCCLYSMQKDFVIWMLERDFEFTGNINLHGISALLLHHGISALLLHHGISALLLHHGISALLLLHHGISALLLHHGISALLLHHGISALLLHHGISALLLLHHGISALLLHHGISALLLHHGISALLLHHGISALLLHHGISALLLLHYGIFEKVREFSHVLCC